MLRACGVGVSLDDFGAGSASFGYLRALNVDGLKFDGSFLQAAETNRRGLALMRSVARMCAELGISLGWRAHRDGIRPADADRGRRDVCAGLSSTAARSSTNKFFARGQSLLRSAA